MKTVKLLKKNIIDFVGSDIHSKRHIIAFDKKIRSNNIKLIENIIEIEKAIETAREADKRGNSFYAYEALAELRSQQELSLIHI